jgi:hypothetical protein
MTTSNQIRISTHGTNTWVNVEFGSKDVQFNLLNAEEVTEAKVKDIVGMAFSICPTIDEIQKHCKLNGILIELDEIFE